MRMKRERSDSLTVVGDENDVGDRIDPDFVELHSVDLRKKRKLQRMRQVPNENSVIVELD
jgi:hypothetical protein